MKGMIEMIEITHQLLKIKRKKEVKKKVMICLKVKQIITLAIYIKTQIIMRLKKYQEIT